MKENVEQENKEEGERKEEKKDRYINQINLFINSINEAKIEESNLPSSVESSLESKASSFNKTLTKLRNEINTVRSSLLHNEARQILPRKNSLVKNEEGYEEGETRKVYSSTIILKQLLHNTLISHSQQGRAIWESLSEQMRVASSAWLQQLLRFPYFFKNLISSLFSLIFLIFPFFSSSPFWELGCLQLQQLSLEIKTRQSEESS